MTKLEPCPFCPDGGKPVAFVEDDGYQEHGGNVYRGAVGCETCGMGLELFKCDNEIPAEWWVDGDEEAPSGFLDYMVIAWNTRYKRTCRIVMREGSPSCSECGAEIDYSARFCGWCGAEVVDDD